MILGVNKFNKSLNPPRFDDETCHDFSTVEESIQGKHIPMDVYERNTPLCF